jgi:hypothetical protein
LPAALGSSISARLKDLVVDLEGLPHGLAAFAETMAAAGLNTEGMCGLYMDGVGIDHVLVEDAESARRALADAGFETGAERDVLVVELEDRPGALADVARRIADAGVDVDLVYLATRTRLVFGVDDLDAAGAALEA